MTEHSLSLTARGHLRAGTDVDRTVRIGDEDDLHAVWNTHFEIQFIRERLLPALDADPGKAPAAAYTRAELAELADVTALQALEANRRLVELLVGRRWMVMQAAREAGASWAEIGKALGMTKQGAMDWYKRKITDQEKYVPHFHDTARARAVLDGDDT
ncbi:hypothetical protein IU414_27230 [Nocardia farcinica]|uniref:hypothetical protein n=1 Tax=Nocardia TaxID=1817 RepID=UPI0003105CE9|nr:MULTISPECIES: hypothetical protein [Nocardia]MBF6588440.1 hypothetical protein [Nocardia farcinica]